MLRKLCIIVFIAYAVFLTPTAYAQKGVYPAFIVTNANDTIHGELKLKKEPQRLRSISFKPTGGNTFSNYSATNLAYYGIGDSLLFISTEVKANDLQQLVFLRVVVNGPVSLYTAENLVSEGIFFLKKPHAPIEVISKNRFLGELNYLLSDCPDFSVNTEASKKLQYTEEHLAATVQAYNSCQHPQLKSRILHTGRQFITKFGLRAGSQVGQLSHMAEKGLYQGRFKEKVALAPILIGSAFVNISEAHKPFAVQIELLLKRYNKDYTREEGDRVIPYTRVVHFSSNVLQIPLLLQYKLPLKQKAQPYLTAGLVGNSFFYSNFMYGITYGNSNIIGNRSEDIYQFGVGYMAGAGLQHKLNNQNKLILDVRYSSETVNTYARQPVGLFTPRKFTFSGIQLSCGITF